MKMRRAKTERRHDHAPDGDDVWAWIVIGLIAAGSMRLRIADLWWPVAFANAAIAVVWTALGAWAAENEWLGVAAVIAVIVPVAIAAFVVPRWTKVGRVEPGGKQKEETASDGCP